MVSYSFKTRFADPIRCGLGIIKPNPDRGLFPKRQTVRAIGKKRHARPGEFVQLYTGLRTKEVRLLGVGVCHHVRPIRIEFYAQRSSTSDSRLLDVYIEGDLLNGDDTRLFVRSDGFKTTADFVRFWDATNGISKPFEGIIIHWEPKT